MKRKRKFGIGLTVTVLFATLALSVSVGCASVATIYVPDDYAKIQWAVDNASAGDTIIVRGGTYYENVNAGKQLTLKSENGSANCIVDARESGSAITLSSNGIKLQGFTVVNSVVNIPLLFSIYSCEEYPTAGIEVLSNGNIIEDNDASKNCYGIYLVNSTNNTLTNNTVDGIGLVNSTNNTLTNNTASNSSNGIYLVESTNNTLTNNTANSNYWYGIGLVESTNNTLTNNTANSNNGGGFYLVESDNNTLTNNNASNNWDGFYLVESDNNTLTNNNASNNMRIYLGDSKNNKIYLNNFINNSVIVTPRWLPEWSPIGTTNIWNSTSLISYTYNGSQFTSYLGNYWSGYYNGADEDGNGIGNTSNYFDDDNIDYHPLVESSENYFITPTPTITSTPSQTPSPLGFETIFAIAGLLAVAYLLRKKG